MPRIRPELVRGGVTLGLFLVLIVVTSHLMPYYIDSSGYTRVGINRMMETPSPFEGLNISSSARVTEITNLDSGFLAGTIEGVDLVFSEEIGCPIEGAHIIFRGTSWISVNNSVVVHEFYTHDQYSSTIRSIPGIVLFVGMFFAIFTADFDSLAFVVKR